MSGLHFQLEGKCPLVHFFIEEKGPGVGGANVRRPSGAIITLNGKPTIINLNVLHFYPRAFRRKNGDIVILPHPLPPSFCPSGRTLVCNVAPLLLDHLN